MLFRVHKVTFGPEELNATPAHRYYGGGRFDATDDDLYPYLYAGETIGVAIAETLLRLMWVSPSSAAVFRACGAPGAERHSAGGSAGGRWPGRVVVLLRRRLAAGGLAVRAARMAALRGGDLSLACSPTRLGCQVPADRCGRFGRRRVAARLSA